MTIERKDYMKVYHKEHYKNNKAIYIRTQKAHKVKYRADFDAWIEDKCCIECGETHRGVLDFHHIDPETKEYNISKKIGRITLKTLLNEINKCIILCANCHRKLHWDLIH